MTFYSQKTRSTPIRNLAQEKSARGPAALPALLRERDLLLFLFLLTVIVPNIQQMQIAGGAAVFFYWLLALLTFQLPSICVFTWLVRQAPPHVPVYLWILRLLHEPWRSLLLFLVVWSMVLILIATLGMWISLLQEAFPGRFHTFPGQCLALVTVLVFATIFTSLPFPLFKIVLWGCGLLFLSFFGLLVVASLVCLFRGQIIAGVFPHSLTTSLPTHFSWSLFGLAILALLGLNGPLLLDGEMRGTQHYLRHTRGYFWWGGLGSFLILLIGTITWMVLAPIAHGNLFQALGQILGPGAIIIAWLLLLAGSFGSILAYMLIFSRACLLAARLRALPRSLTWLNHTGTPLRAILAQSALIFCVALFLFLIIPTFLRIFFPAVLLTDVLVSDQFDLVTSLTSSVWGGLNSLMFLFAFWLFIRKHRHTWNKWGKDLALTTMCLAGWLTSLICAGAPFLPDWPSLFLSRNHWFPLILFSIICILVLAWMVSELPRRSALLRDKAQLLAGEKVLRGELQQAYTRECTLHSWLQEAYHKQQVLILQQQLHLKEVNQLYREQEKAAMTDPVTGLLNHRAFIERLDETILYEQQNATSFLLVFLDLDHFKVINDTWGHLAGDAVLCEVGQRLRKTLRPGDYVGRYGGEEFALILSGTTIKKAWEEGERLRQIIQTTPYRWQGVGETTAEIIVTVSIGIAAYGIHGTQREELLEMADLLMYRAKLDGRNCVRVANEQTCVARLSLPKTYTRVRNQWEQMDGRIKCEENTTQLSVQALQGLAAMIQAHDATTSTHACRLVWLAEATGYHLGALQEDLFLMRMGGLFHDIGKIGVSDAILNKNGPLNEEEWEVMHRHPIIGARILEKMGGFFSRLVPVVLAHHERWDGTGYPQGLKELEIPLASRVLGVVDAYDTMVSRRPYKEPMPESAAEAELRRGAGTQFDPTVVQSFLTVLKTAPASDPIGYNRDLEELFSGVDGNLHSASLINVSSLNFPQKPAGS
jgi:diguanylate cyclase (GGDEF)-like protein